METTKEFKINIEQYLFSISDTKRVKNLRLGDIPMGEDWPVVYILNGAKSAYVGETNNAFKRMEQHLKNEKRNAMRKVSIIFGKEFNKSATLDFENKLIQHMHADAKFSLQNANKGQSVKHNYYQREIYEQTFQTLWDKLKEIGLVDHTLYEVRNSEIFKYSPYKQLTEDQYDCVKLMLDLTGIAIKENKNEKLIVEGGAGTGKSVLAVYYLKCLKDLIDRKTNFDDLDIVLPENSEIIKSIELVKTIHEHKDIKIGYVVPTPSFKNTVSKVFTKTPGLNKSMVIKPIDVSKNDYDILIVDEAHRLKNYKFTQQHGYHKESNRKLGIDDEASELDMILAKPRCLTVLFYDSLQTIRKSDVDRSEFDRLFSDSSMRTFKLSSQLRIKGGNEYIDFIKKLLFDKARPYRLADYDLRILDNPKDLMDLIVQKDKEKEGLCRVMSGYAYDWSNRVRKHKAAEGVKDIDVNGDGKYIYKWNSEFNDSKAILDRKRIDEILSVFACQGYDLNYAGVILGPDLFYNKKTKRIDVDINKVCDSKMIIPGNEDATKRNVLNQYLVLLTRGIEGTAIYAVDSDLRDYLKKLIIKK